MEIGRRLVAGTVLIGVAVVFLGVMLKFEGLASTAATFGFLAIGLFVGLGVSLWTVRSTPMAVVAGYAIGIIVGVIVGAGTISRFDLSSTVLVLIFGSAAIISLCLAYVKMWRDNEPLRLESDWGSLGHGLGGWQLSVPAALLLAAFLFGGIAAGGLVATSAKEKPPEQGGKPGGGPTTDPASDKGDQTKKFEPKAAVPAVEGSAADAKRSTGSAAGSQGAR